MSDEKVKEMLGLVEKIIQKSVKKKDYGEANYWDGYARALEDVLGEEG